MRPYSTVVGTVIHQKSLKNLKFFLKSIEAQSDKDFELLILNVSKKKLNLKKKILKLFL